MHRMFADLDQPIKRLAVNQGFKICADQHIGCWLSCFGITLNADRMVGARHHAVAHIGLKRQSRATPIEIHRDKRRVIDGNSHLFHRRDQYIVIPVTSQNR